jgi:hypothetical protein
MASILTGLSKIGHKQKDTEDIRIQKSFLVYLAIFMSVGGIVWGTVSVSYELYFQSIFPYGYVLVSIINMLIFYQTKNIKIVRFIQVLISLILPFAFQWSLGGFSASGIIMLWAILSLIASLSFQSIRTSINWLLVYIAMTIASAYFDDYAKALKPDVLPEGSVTFVVINLVLISSIVFGLVVFFVHRYRLAEVDLQKQKDQLAKANMVLKNSQKSLMRSYKELKEKMESQPTGDGGPMSQLDMYEKILQDQKKLIAQYELGKKPRK